ncbi:MAG: CoA pyrophosphatase [Actinomycetota bacterium]|nr:CoA pyrophosphatase [Actinomycetota bacterium]
MSSASSSLPDALRAVLLDPADAASVEVHGRMKAAVLVALYDGMDLRSPQGSSSGRRHTKLHAVFTRRRDDMRSHAGEISFPGGRRDEEDADLLSTALREAEEEIGLPRHAVHVLGALHPTPTVATNYGVYPFVGLIEPGREWMLSPREVDEVLELRLGDLRAARTRRRLLHRGIPFRSVVYDVGPEAVIWGATARIVGDLLARIDPRFDGASEPPAG